MTPSGSCSLLRTAWIKSLRFSRSIQSTPSILHSFLAFDSVRGFKSFGDEVQRFTFSEGFNLIVGTNGSGKSNILDAISFALCGKTSALRVRNVSELQSTDTKEPCEVSLEIQIYGNPAHDCHILNLSVKVLPNDMRQYKLNGKLKSMKEVKELLKEHRLLLEETSAVVQQSRVTELADTNSALTSGSIISAASGAGRWNEEVEKAQKELKKTRLGLEEIQENICMLECSIAEDNVRLKKMLRAEQVARELCSALLSC